jgi:DNA invertase Pin-like site-specific DNA recombinase
VQSGRKRNVSLCPAGWRRRGGTRAELDSRKKEGIAAAKAAGVYRGRKRSLTQEQVKEIKSRVAAHDSRTALAREFGISRQTSYAALKAAYLEN